MTSRAALIISLALLVVGYFSIDFANSWLNFKKSNSRYTLVGSSTGVFVFDDKSTKLLHCDEGRCVDVSDNISSAKALVADSSRVVSQRR